MRAGGRLPGEGGAELQGEVRQDPLTRRWVIYAPLRKHRPHDGVPGSGAGGAREAVSSGGAAGAALRDAAAAGRRGSERPDACPFCPGNESLLPGIVMQMPESGPWRTRVVPNRFPAVWWGADRGVAAVGPYRVAGACGLHEVIIESPNHGDDIPLMDLQAVRAVVDTYHRRYEEISASAPSLRIFIFRNHGPGAGHSVAHPHSQVLATPLEAPRARLRELGAQRYFEEVGRCPLCDVLAFEGRDGERLLWEDGSFLAFVPFAAEVPYQLWLVPRRHLADFAAAGEAEKAGLAAALRALLGRLRAGLGDPPYNLILHSAPRSLAGAPYLHWYVEICPRLVTPGGFEVGSGINVNPSLPEQDANHLRAQKVSS